MTSIVGNVTAAALYVRISQDRAGDELGVKRQREDCVKLAEARGWDVAEIYTDDDRSAFSGKPRPAYESMMTDIASGKVQAIVAWHPDRLHRSPVELERFIRVIEDTGAQVATVTAGELDLSTASGRMTARVVGAVARHESEQKSERLRRQREQMALSGRPHGGRRAFGYDKRGQEIIDAEAAQIREAVDRVFAGESLRTIAFDWNERKVQSTSGRPWSVVTLRSMLTGPRLAGLRVHRGEVVGKAEWPAILTRDQHDAVRAVLGNPRARKQGRPPTTLLGGFIYCAKCGAKMHGSTRSGGTRRYACVVRPETNGCGRVAIQAARTEDLIVEVIMARLDTPALAATVSVASDTITEDVEVLEDRLAQLADAYAAGEITKPEWMRARAGVDRRLAEARQRRDSVDAQAVIAPVAAPGVLRAAWPELHTDQRRSILAAIIERVVIAPAAVGGRFDSDRISIEWRA